MTDTNAAPSEAIRRLGEYLQEQQRRKDEKRKRIPLPSSLLPSAEQQRMFPLWDNRRIAAARPQMLWSLINLISAGHEAGIETTKLAAALVEAYQGQDGFFYAHVNFIGGYHVLGPHASESEAYADGWFTLEDIAGYMTHSAPIRIPA
jgi:hypothetical protein